jgi:hypothetical protein
MCYTVHYIILYSPFGSDSQQPQLPDQAQYTECSTLCQLASC